MIPFIDLGAQQEQIKESLDKRIQEVLSHGRYINGPEVAELEEILAEYIGVKHCIGVSNGTDALLLALVALGIGPGDEVIVPDFSFFASAEVVEFIGAKSIFVDVDESTCCIDVSKVEQKITSKTKAIIPVSMYGQCADLQELEEICKSKNLFLIEDGAQSFGATRNGKKSLSFGDVGCTSFFPSKPLGCYGDGGACFTNNDDVAQRIKELRTHGQEKRYYHTHIGANSRLDTLQAAILIEKMRIFEDEVEKRQAVAKRYKEGLKDKFDLIQLKEGNLSVFAQFTLKTSRREELIEHLKKNNVPYAIHYPFPISQQPVYKKLYNLEAEPISKKMAEQVISLPFSPYLKAEDQEKVIETLLSFN